jgi:hypothetical protein
VQLERHLRARRENISRPLPLPSGWDSAAVSGQREHAQVAVGEPRSPGEGGRQGPDEAEDLGVMLVSGLYGRCPWIFGAIGAKYAVPHGHIADSGTAKRITLRYFRSSEAVPCVKA